MNVIKFFKSFQYAFTGVIAATKERNFKFHLTAMVVVLIAAYFTGISRLEWMVLIAVIALMLALEMINSAIERVVDLVTTDWHPLAKTAKDLAAGAVLIFAIASIMIGFIIFIPKWFAF